nr:DEAD/DEAH box helicase [Actinorhabdospora filicis]
MPVDETEVGELTPVAPVRPDSPTLAELGVRSETVEALDAVGITRAFAIQEYAIPIAMRGTDVIGRAPTGTGKTLGFGIPILERVLGPDEGADGRPQALVVVPTRELGLQVSRDIELAGKLRGVRVLPVYGGRAYEPQIEALRTGVDIVVGTPGRLIDLMKAKHLRFDGIQIVVLDEADRMLDLGFAEDVEKLLGALPEERQTMLFSATMPDSIVALSRRYLHQPMTIHADVAVDPAASGGEVRELAYLTHSLNKIEVLARILQAKDRGLTIVFSRTKRHAQRIADDLDFRGFAVGAVHGDLGQSARERALRAFRNGKIDILVATDVAARGIDVRDVTHVINYDSPEDVETYVHRRGRTGRAGATGIAITFVSWEDAPRWKIIDKTLELNLGEPVETYHTSAHLYTDLDIPTDVTSELPKRDRSREGLSAEEEIDVEGGKASRSRRRAKSPAGSQSESRPSRERPARERSAERPSRTRTEVTESGEGTERRRQRRRTPAQRTDEVTVEAVDAAVQATAVQDVLVAEPVVEKPARTRTRRQAPVAQTPAVQDETPREPAAQDADTLVAEPVVEKPARTRTRRQAPVAQDEAPAVREETPVVRDEVPAVREEAPVSAPKHPLHSPLVPVFSDPGASLPPVDETGVLETRTPRRRQQRRRPDAG